MALTAQQTQQLDIASQRKLAGTATPTDLANLAYATKTYNYSYNPSAPTTTTGPTATSLPAGMTQLTSPDQISQYNIAGQVGATGTSGSYLYGTPKTAIPADGIGTQTQVSVSPPPPNTNIADSSIAGATKQADLNTQTIDQVKSQLDPVSQQLFDLYNQESGKSAYTAGQETANNIPGLNQQLADINGQIQTGVAEYNQLKDSIEKSYLATSLDNRGKAITMDRIIGNQAQIDYKKQLDNATILSTKAGDIALLQARALGVQGQIEAAQKAVERAVALKYGPIEEQIATKQAQLQLIQPLLNKQEKLQANALQLQYDAQKQALADAKTKETDFQNLLITAAANGAPAALITKAQLTKDPVTAATILSAYLKSSSGGSQTSSIQEYEYYVKQEQAAGRKPLSYNEYQNLDANRKRSLSTTNNVTYGTKLEDQQIADFNKAAGEYVLKLAANEISWGAAWNAMRAQFPQASNDRIDASLNKAAYYPK
jgi:hypothetical protein